MKRNFKFYILSLKRNLISLFFLLFAILLVIFSSSNLIAAKSGLKLWALSVVPSLFPFFIATNLLNHTKLVNYFSKFFNKIMRPLFNVPGEASYAFILGLISGYPVGAKIVSSLKNANLCTKDEAERMLCFTNNSGPLFIIGTVGISLFSNSAIGFLLLFTHILASISVGIILGLLSRLKKDYSKPSLKSNLSSNKKIASFSNLGEVLSESILDASKTIILIGGFVILFSIILAILKQSHVLSVLSVLISPILQILHIPTQFAEGIISGLFELTNGILLICNIPCKNIWINILCCAFLLSFGGFSVLIQVVSVCSKSDIKIKKYLWGKILQACLATFYTYILLNFLPIFSINL